MGVSVPLCVPVRSGRKCVVIKVNTLVGVSQAVVLSHTHKPCWTCYCPFTCNTHFSTWHCLHLCVPGSESGPLEKTHYSYTIESVFHLWTIERSLLVFSWTLTFPGYARLLSCIIVTTRCHSEVTTALEVLKDLKSEAYKIQWFAVFVAASG